MAYLPLIGEFLGTWLLVLSVLVSSGNAAVIGATVALVVFLLGKISGGHINPAISLAVFLKGEMNLTKFSGYLMAQLLGGAASVYTYKMLMV
jgi:aquaporin Z